MNCEKCGYDGVPDGARFCPECGQPIAAAAQSGAQITVTQDVGSVAGGEVSGVDVGQVTGDVTVESTPDCLQSASTRSRRPSSRGTMSTAT